MSRNKAPLFILIGIIALTAILGVLLLQTQNKPAPPASVPSQPRTAGDTTTQPATTAPNSIVNAAPTAARATTLLLYCAAGIKNPVAKIAADYEKEFGVRVDLQYGGSGTLLANIKLAGRGDLFIPADGSYIELARKDHLIDEVIPLASMSPVIAVKKGNPKQVAGPTDLMRPGLRIALCNPQAASIGQVTKNLFTKAGLWNDLEAAAKDRGVFKPTVNDIANDVRLGTVDAAIVWDTTVRQADYASQLDALPIEGAQAFAVETPVAVLRTTTSAPSALHFARYLAASDRGLKTFEANGFTPVAGDPWSDRPNVLLFSGAVNRTGIKDALAAFEQREGVEVTTVYNGCGILNGQIKLGERPDAYYTCDATFMEPIADVFGPYELMSQTTIVILVQKGNPHAIKTLADLAKPGIKVGVGHEKQSTLGTLTANMLQQRNLYDAVQKNVVTNSPTGDLLVNQTRTGSLDAAIVYNVNTMFVRDHLDVVAIDDPLANAVQSLAVSKQPKFPRLTQRLVTALHAPEVREKIIRAGFRPVPTSQPAN